VEDAIFNAGLGSVDDNFKGNQYFSCPNQVLANDTCNHIGFFRGRDWMSYAPKKFLACCAGNVHRFMPNFVYRSWLKGENALTAFTYAPTEIEVVLVNGKVKIIEDSLYPFENKIKFTVRLDKPFEFDLLLRKPKWAIEAILRINGKESEVGFENNLCKLTRRFEDGDEITLEFTDKIELIENAKGISVKKGALLYALPIKEREKIEGLRELGNPDFPHYSLAPDSKWNYGLCIKENLSFKSGKIGDRPWKREDNGCYVEATGRETENWKLLHVKKYRVRFKPRAKYQWEENERWFTPKVKESGKNKFGAEEKLKLVPYCTTRLRIAIFPIVDEGQP
jgi:hypothetical protein